jgi:uncharacterized protein HemY
MNKKHEKLLREWIKLLTNWSNVYKKLGRLSENIQCKDYVRARRNVEAALDMIDEIVKISDSIKD